MRRSSSGRARDLQHLREELPRVAGYRPVAADARIRSIVHEEESVFNMRRDPCDPGRSGLSEVRRYFSAGQPNPLSDCCGPAFGNESLCGRG